MYMSGLGFDDSNVFPGTFESDSAPCVAQGGVPNFYWQNVTDWQGFTVGKRKIYNGCNFPPKVALPAPGPVTQITTATTVSPQVSPGFVQQSNPSNSPATVGTRQDTGGSVATPSVSQPIASPNIEQPPVVFATSLPPPQATIPVTTPAQQDSNLWDLFSRMVTGANGGGQQSQPGITYVPSGGGGAPVTITTAGPSASLFTPRWIAALIALALGTAYVLKPSRTYVRRTVKRKRSHVR